MTVSHARYELTNTAATTIPIYGNTSARGSVAIVQNSEHGGGSHDVLLGGSTLNLATESYGHRLKPGESLTIPIWFSSTDTLYAMSSGATGEVHVLIVGA